MTVPRRRPAGMANLVVGSRSGGLVTPTRRTWIPRREALVSVAADSAQNQEWVQPCIVPDLDLLGSWGNLWQGAEGPGQSGVAFDGGVPLRINPALLDRIVGIRGEEHRERYIVSRAASNIAVFTW
jgi:hypothetical protein